MAGTAQWISREDALRLCAEIREQYQGKFWTLAGLQCWGCVTFTKGQPDKMCWANAAGNRGCTLVNIHFDQQVTP